jgi:hypothetical protein
MEEAAFERVTERKKKKKKIFDQNKVYDNNM